jgi:hypothetical protein
MIPKESKMCKYLSVICGRLAGLLVVPAGTEVILLHVGIEVFAGVEQIRGRAAARRGIAAQHHAVAVVESTKRVEGEVAASHLRVSAGVGLAGGVGGLDEGLDGKVGGHPEGVEGQLLGGGLVEKDGRAGGKLLIGPPDDYVQGNPR